MEQKIIVVYRKDGTVERYPVGFAGTQCHTATAPYTAIDEQHGAVTDTPTGEACLPEVKAGDQVKLKK